jgi:hypothetical protein
MPLNQAIVPISALTTIGCVLVVLGLLAGGAIEIVGLGLGAVVVAAVLGTVLVILGGRHS